MCTQISKQDFLQSAVAPGVILKLTEEAQLDADLARFHDMTCNVVASLWPFSSPTEITKVLQSIADIWGNELEHLSGYLMLLDWVEEEKGSE